MLQRRILDRFEVNGRNILSPVTRCGPDGQRIILDCTRREVVKDDVVRHGQDGVIVTRRTADSSLQFLRGNIENHLVQVRRQCRRDR